MVKILVVEDGEFVWESFFRTLVLIFKIPQENIHRARWYTEGQEMIQSEIYDIIFLDHNMPYSDPGTDDEEKIYDLIRPVGYGLLPLVREKQPQAVVVGTSSMAPQASLPFDFLIDKSRLSDEIRPLLARFLH